MPQTTSCEGLAEAIRHKPYMIPLIAVGQICCNEIEVKTQKVSSPSRLQ